MTTEHPSPQALVEAYRSAFERKDVKGCAELFSDDATLKFLFATYQGRDAIEAWHADRFAAEVELLSIEAVRAESDAVVVEAVATSRRLRFFRIPKVKGTIRFRIRDGRLAEAVFSPRGGVASHLDWQFR